MANYDYLFAYDSRMEEWLGNEGCSVPAARPRNRLPTKGEVIGAIEHLGMQADIDGEHLLAIPPPDAPAAILSMTRISQPVEIRNGRVEKSGPPVNYIVRMQCRSWRDSSISDDATSISMVGYFPTELFLTYALTQQCGQLVLYPASGEPPVVVQPEDDIGRIATLWLDVVNSGSSWADFYRRVNEPM